MKDAPSIKWMCSDCYRKKDEHNGRTCNRCGQTGKKYPVNTETNDTGREVKYDPDTDTFREVGEKAVAPEK